MKKRLIDIETRTMEIFRELEAASKSYQSKVNLPCLEGCGKCCNSPEVEASPLEMLPAALSLLRNGKAEETLNQLEYGSPETCYFYEKHNAEGNLGKCSIYQERPILCRSFATNAYSNKYGTKTLSVCKEIKKTYPQAYEAVSSRAELLQEAPLTANWTRQLLGLSSGFSLKSLPINEALREALKTVLYAIDLENQSECLKE